MIKNQVEKRTKKSKEFYEKVFWEAKLIFSSHFTRATNILSLS
tara:strand:- start:386 stop:514 length:129 start_codon:yes stop_codon:yes gene_type:complete